MNARHIALVASAFLLANLHAQDAAPTALTPAATTKPATPPAPIMVWHDVTKWGTEGRA